MSRKIKTIFSTVDDVNERTIHKVNDAIVNLIRENNKILTIDTKPLSLGFSDGIKILHTIIYDNEIQNNGIGRFIEPVYVSVKEMNNSIVEDKVNKRIMEIEANKGKIVNVNPIVLGLGFSGGLKLVYFIIYEAKEPMVLKEDIKENIAKL